MLKFLNAVLNLFDGSGAGAASGGGDGGATTSGENTSAVAEQTSGEDLSKVIYGKQEKEDTSAVAEQTEPTLEERTKSYKELINGQYKDIHTSEMQKIFDRRFKDHKELEKKVNDQGAIIERLAERYGVEQDNLDSLLQAIDDDENLWIEEADEAGLSFDQYKKFKKLNRERNSLLKAEQERQKQIEIDERVRKWNQEAETLKTRFPGFDLAVELNNQAFADVLQMGMPMDVAYKVAHFDELQNGLAQAVAIQTEKKVTDSVRAKGTRPIENGTTSSGAFTTKSDPSKWTKKDREEIARRVARGDEIRL